MGKWGAASIVVLAWVGLVKQKTQQNPHNGEIAKATPKPRTPEGV